MKQKTLPLYIVPIEFITIGSLVVKRENGELGRITKITPTFYSGRNDHYFVIDWENPSDNPFQNAGYHYWFRQTDLVIGKCKKLNSFYNQIYPNGVYYYE